MGLQFPPAAFGVSASFGVAIPLCPVGRRWSAEEGDCVSAPPPPPPPSCPTAPTTIPDGFHPTESCSFPYPVQARNPKIANGIFSMYTQGIENLDVWHYGDENCYFAANTPLSYGQYPTMDLYNRPVGPPGLVVYETSNPAHRCRIYSGPSWYGCGDPNNCPYAQDIYMFWYKRLSQ